MRRTIAISLSLLLGSAIALAQAGTNNNSSTQHEVKSKTGRSGEILLSPDINQKITGNVGYTEGATPDVSSYNAPATAGAVSNGAESTAAVTASEQITRQYIEDRLARASGTPGTNGELPPNAFNQGATPQAAQEASAEPDKQPPGEETNAHTSGSQREKANSRPQAQMPQGDHEGQNPPAKESRQQKKARPSRGRQ